MEFWQMSADLEFPAHVKLLPGHHLHQGDVQLLGFQRDSHGQGLIGLQEARADPRHPFSFQDYRNGHQVLPAETGTPGTNHTGR